MPSPLFKLLRATVPPTEYISLSTNINFFYISGPAISGAVNLQPYQQPVIMTSVAAQPPVVYQMQPVSEKNELLFS